jgi:hypothetical protein
MGSLIGNWKSGCLLPDATLTKRRIVVNCDENSSEEIVLAIAKPSDESELTALINTEIQDEGELTIDLIEGWGVPKTAINV